MYTATDIDPFRASPPGQGTNSRRFRRGAIRGECPKRFAGQALASLGKDRNAAMAGWGRSLRAGQEVLIRCVTPLGKGMALPGKAGLAAKRFLAR